MERAKINRINEFALKSKTIGLSPEEKEEQRKLRNEYIQSFRSNLKATLDSIVLMDKNGNKLQLKKENT